MQVHASFYTPLDNTNTSILLDHLLILSISFVEMVQTMPSKVGMKGSKVTLDCTFNSSERWYLMQWKLKLPDKDDVTITTLLNSGKSSSPMPIWENGISDNFRKRARTSVFVDISTVDFSLSINDFSCNDTGIYLCEVTAANSARNTTNLTITGKHLYKADLQPLE